MEELELRIERIESPIGIVEAVESDAGLCAIDFADCRERMESLLAARLEGRKRVRWHEGGGAATAARIRAYFEGELDALGSLPLDPWGTPFQRQVWTALRAVGAGSTATYGQIATTIGRPSAARAVGAANARNPIALAIPCHRIVGADRSLTGYAGGIERKRWLLAHEGAQQSLQ